MSKTSWIILAIVNIPVYLWLGWFFFRTWGDFWDSVKFWLTPNIFSALGGRYWDDMWAELKLILWIICSVGAVFGEAYLIGKMSG